MNNYIKYKNKSDILINKISLHLSDNQNGGGRYGIVTLLMMGDNYLPGCLVLAKSILQFNKPKNIDLICMVTDDVSEKAIHDLEKYFDKIIKVPYINIDLKYVNLEKVKDIYSKTFTKINCLKLIDYSKILLIDSDMVIVNNKIFDVFNYATPAGVFLNCIRAHEKDSEKIYKKIYKKFLNGYSNVAPKNLYNMNCNEVLSKYNIKYDDKYNGINNDNIIGKIFVETSICLLSPSLDDFNKMFDLLKNIVNNKRAIINGDTNLLNIYYKYKWHIMDYHYLGRWIDPEKNNNYIILDLYGFDGKPWQIEKYKKIKSYGDVKYWVKKFISFYESSFLHECIHENIHKIYDFFITQ